MEHKIGDIVALPPFGIKARVEEVPDNICDGCYYKDDNICQMWTPVIGECLWIGRKDQKNIIFKPLSKEEEE